MVAAVRRSLSSHISVGTTSNMAMKSLARKVTEKREWGILQRVSLFYHIKISTTTLMSFSPPSPALVVIDVSSDLFVACFYTFMVMYFK